MTPTSTRQTHSTSCAEDTLAEQRSRGGDAPSMVPQEAAGEGTFGPAVDASGTGPPAPGPLPRPPRLTRQTVTVLRAVLLDPNAARDLRHLTAHTGLPRPTVRSILDRLTRSGWTSIEPDPTDTARAHPRHLYQLTDVGAHAASRLDRGKAVAVFRWDHPRSPRIVATDSDLVLVATAMHAVAAPAVPWPLVEVVTTLSRTPALWYATTRHRGVLLWPDPATGVILAAHHPDVPAAPAPIIFTTPDGQPRILDGAYTQLRTHDVRAALQRWWRTHTPPDTLAFQPTPLRIPPCSQ
jgi:DNA-binding MarR family transcriptional regulator